MRGGRLGLQMREIVISINAYPPARSKLPRDAVRVLAIKHCTGCEYLTFRRYQKTSAKEDRPPSTLEGFKSYKAGGSYLQRTSCRLSLIAAGILQYAFIKRRNLVVWWILQHPQQQWKDPFASASAVSDVFRGVLVRKGRIIDRMLHSTHFPLIRSG